MKASGTKGSKSRAAAPAPSKRKGKFVLTPTVSVPAVLDRSGGSDRSFRQLLYDISTAASHLESARAYLASRLGVTSPQYNMIMVIAQYEGDEGMSVNEIADHLHVSATFVTAELKKLERQGLVVKLPNPADARSVIVRLSEEGERQVTALGPEFLFVNDHLFENISAADFQALSRIVASLIADFSRTVAMLQVVAQADPAGGSGASLREGVSKALRRATPPSRKA
jgi:DNA-binding MarR family transcriptional regulator